MFGVFGMLALGVLVFCLRAMSGDRAWSRNERFVRLGFLGAEHGACADARARPVPVRRPSVRGRDLPRILARAGARLHDDGHVPHARSGCGPARTPCSSSWASSPWSSRRCAWFSPAVAAGLCRWPRHRADGPRHDMRTSRFRRTSLADRCLKLAGHICPAVEVRRARAALRASTSFGAYANIPSRRRRARTPPRERSVEST